MTPFDYLQAARVPLFLKPQEFGLWQIIRQEISGNQDPADYPGAFLENTIERGWEQITYLRHATLSIPGWDTVMEDSARELRRHLPIWLAAHGRVLITGLGLGCVVRGLLPKPSVEHIDVVEIDSEIIRVVGQEFAGNPRVTLHHGDALNFEFPAEIRWDFAWHDIWVDPNEEVGLQRLHGQLMVRFCKQVGRQGAWGFPRVLTRHYTWSIGPMIGTPRIKSSFFLH